MGPDAMNDADIHVCPCPCERDRGGAPDATSRASDDRHPAFEMSRHDAPLLLAPTIRYRGMPGCLDASQTPTLHWRLRSRPFYRVLPPAVK
jgi:hypothetical protein